MGVFFPYKRKVELRGDGKLLPWLDCRGGASRETWSKGRGGRELATLLPIALLPCHAPVPCASVHHTPALLPAPRAAELRMRETPCAAALQGFLQYLHPSRAGRRRVASVEKHLCACGTALWTHIRSLVFKSKVGLRVGRGFRGGWCQAGSLPPGVGLCSPPCPSPGRLGLGCVCQSLSWEEERGEGLSDYRSLEGKERYLSAAVSPYLQLPDVEGNRPFPWE